MLPLPYDVCTFYGFGELVELDDPCGYRMGLGWAASCPPSGARPAAARNPTPGTHGERYECASFTR